MNLPRMILTAALLSIVVGGVIWVTPDHFGLSWPSASSPGQSVSRVTDTRSVPTPDTTTDSWAANVPPADPVTPAASPDTQFVRLPVIEQGTNSGSCRVHHNHLFRWQHSGRLEGGHPYASSEEEAFTDSKLDHWLACNGERIPEADRSEIKRLLRLEHDGRIAGMTTVILHDGDRLDTMMSGYELEDNVLVQLGRQQGAYRFEVDVNGHHYVFVLPTGCWNWSLGPAIAVPQAIAAPDDCAYVMATVETSDVVRVAVSVPNGMRLPSTCWAQHEGGEWLAWPGRCDECSWVEAHSAVPGSEDREIREPGRWTATQRVVELRVPRIVADRGYIGFCIERRGHSGHSHTIWVEPGDWHKPEYRYTVQTPWTWVD